MADYWATAARHNVAGLCVGWTARGYYYEREERET